MAVALADLLGFHDRLVRALASDVRRVRDQNGEEVEYKSTSEIKSALAAIESQIAAAQSARRSTVLFSTSKGL